MSIGISGFIPYVFSLMHTGIVGKIEYILYQFIEIVMCGNMILDSMLFDASQEWIIQPKQSTIFIPLKPYRAPIRFNQYFNLISV